MIFQLADRTQEQALRALMRQNIMPGWVQLAYGREPDFFHGLGVQGKFNQVVLALDKGEPVGMGGRSIRTLHVNGAPRDVGYLAGLRSLERVRRNTGLVRGYRFLRQLHADGRAPAYLTTILEDNAYAREMLTSGRAGLPRYLDQGQIITYAVNINRRRRPQPTPPSLTIRPGHEVPLDRLLGFLNGEGARRQFFPVVSADDFGSDLLRGLSPRDFLVAERDGTILGTVAKWDQSAFRQYLVCGYAGMLAAGRPILNLLLRAAGFQPLPRPGDPLRMFYAAFVCVRDNNAQVLAALLERLHDENKDAGYHFMAIGFHERDPLWVAVKGFFSFPYASRLYLVCWEDGMHFVNQLDPDRIPHLEIATL